MAFGPLPNLIDLSVGELYAVYTAVAEADHQWRLQAMYGRAAPPPGHAVLRKLPFTEFENRLRATESVPRGDLALRSRLARQAAAYHVDTASVIEDRRAA